MRDQPTSATRIPLGPQVLQVPPSVTEYLLGLGLGAARLDATQMWFSHSKGRIELHVGDIDISSVSDSDL